METSRDDFVIAIRSAFLKKGIKQKFSLLSLILFSIFILILGNFNFKALEYNRTIIKEIVYYSSFIATIPENIIKNSFNKMSDHFEYYDDYQAQKKELQVLKNKDLTQQIITYENIELKKLIDDYFVVDNQVYAKVLIDKESLFLRSIIINKGSKNGIKVGMIAYDDIYLIGKVVDVNYLTSRVLLISDINSKVPVTIQPINIQAIMTGLKEQEGVLQYIEGEELSTNNDEKLIVVTSGSGGVFKSGIPIGKIKSTRDMKENTLIVNFYRKFSQLKYVKIASFKKENIRLDKSNQIEFEANNDKILKINNLKKDIILLQQQKTINEEIRKQFEEENTQLKENLINFEENKKEEQLVNKDIKFLQLNLLHGHKCRRSLFKSKLHIIGTIEYRNCVLNKGLE